MTDELMWKDIPNYEGYYEANRIGQIRSVARWVRNGRGKRLNPSVILKPSIGQWGYEQVSLAKDGHHKTERVNRLIAMTFIENCDNLPQVNHKDGNKTNNCVENLEWCSASHNMKHCYENGMSNWAIKVRIKETGEEFNSIAECARGICGDRTNIEKCIRGERKTHKGYHFEVIGRSRHERR